MGSLAGRSGPLYRRVAEDITEQIETGQLAPGDKLPSERALCDIYGVSQITVRRALRELRHAGVLISRHGLGWYVGEREEPSRPSCDVALVLPELDWFLGPLASHILCGLGAAGLTSRLVFPGPDASVAGGSAEARGLSGVRAAVVTVDDRVPAGAITEALRERSVPTLLLLDELDGADRPAVVLDEEACLAQVTRYVLDLGHRRVAYVGADPSTTSGRKRYWGFANALWGRGLELPLDWVWTGPVAREAAPRLRAIFSSGGAPTAVVCADDLRAAALMATLQDMGRRCPGDVAIVSVGDRDFCPLLPTPLTTLRFDLRRLADTAVAMTIDLLAGREVESVRITGQVIARQSCGSALPAPD